MTTIPPFAAGSYFTSQNAAQLVSLKSQLDTLSTQLSTGLTAQTYGGLGIGRSTALGAQATLSALTGYAAGITAAQTRTNLAVTSLTQVATLASSTQASLQNGLQSTPPDMTASTTLAQGNLEAALDALDQSAGGSYLFGGSNTSTPPVLDANAILNGTTTSSGQALDGLKTLVSQQVQADAGASGNGRLTQSQPTSATVALTEDTGAEARANFGFSIAGATTTGTAFAASLTPATPDRVPVVDVRPVRRVTGRSFIAGGRPCRAAPRPSRSRTFIASSISARPDPSSPHGRGRVEGCMTGLDPPRPTSHRPVLDAR